MILLKFAAVASNAAEAQRNAIEPSCQFFTRWIRCRTPPFVLSITLVVARQRSSFGGRPIALIVNNSSRPSNKLADAEGCFFSYHLASCSICRLPCSADSFHAARRVDLTLACCSLGR